MVSPEHVSFRGQFVFQSGYLEFFGPLRAVRRTNGNLEAILDFLIEVVGQRSTLAADQVDLMQNLNLFGFLVNPEDTNLVRSLRLVNQNELGSDGQHSLLVF